MNQTIKESSGNFEPNVQALAQSPRENTSDSTGETGAGIPATGENGDCCQQRLVLSVASVITELSGDIYQTYAFANMDDNGEKYYIKITERLIEMLAKLGVQISESKVSRQDNIRTLDSIEDGFGSSWSAYCPTCNRPSMSVVRPGKVQCSYCD